MASLYAISTPALLYDNPSSSVSFQAVSKWENGGLPNVEILSDLAALLEITVDELLAGVEKELEGLSYSKAGVDIAYSDAIKREMKQYLKTSDPRVLNGLGPFASLYDKSIHYIHIPSLVFVLNLVPPI